MKIKDVIKYLKNKAYKEYKKDNLINYQYIKNCVITLEEIKDYEKK